MSPFHFRCAQCRQTTELLETLLNGADAEMGKLEGENLGSRTYRGQGPDQPFPCAQCGHTPCVELIVALGYTDEYRYCLEEDGLAFPMENLFSGLHLDTWCAACHAKFRATDLETNTEGGPTRSAIFAGAHQRA